MLAEPPCGPPLRREYGRRSRGSRRKASRHVLNSLRQRAAGGQRRWWVVARKHHCCKYLKAVSCPTVTLSWTPALFPALVMPRLTTATLKLSEMSTLRLVTSSSSPVRKCRKNTEGGWLQKRIAGGTIPSPPWHGGCSQAWAVPDWAVHA